MSTYSLGDVMKLRTRLEAELRRDCLAASAQRFTEVLFEELEDSAVLFRVFVTVPYGMLREPERSFAETLVRARAESGELSDATPVVCLLGSSGKRKEWNDRSKSVRHLAVPLTQASFIQTIPMIARLMSDMDTGIEWVDKQKNRIMVKSFGTMARVLYVEDAAATKTADGFKLIPDQDFVKENGVKTVIGLGGAYLNRSVVAVLLFTNESIPRQTAEKLMPVINTFKVATMKLAAEGRIFESKGE